nr:3-methyl-2-oxobutanoate hydroxymethyltransferase [Pseudobutyrivibrio sp.]
SGLKPKFVKHFANIGEEMKNAFKAYDSEVKSKAFPAEEHNFAISSEVMNEVRAAAAKTEFKVEFETETV